MSEQEKTFSQLVRSLSDANMLKRWDLSRGGDFPVVVLRQTL